MMKISAQSALQNARLRHTRESNLSGWYSVAGHRLHDFAGSSDILADTPEHAGGVGQGKIEHLPGL